MQYIHSYPPYLKVVSPSATRGRAMPHQPQRTSHGHARSDILGSDTI